MDRLERVLLVTGALSGGGAEYQWRVLGRALRRLGHEVHVATLSDAPTEYAAELDVADVPHYALAAGFFQPGHGRAARARSLGYATARLRGLVQSLQPDVVYSSLTVTNLIARSATLGSRCRLVWGIRGLSNQLSRFPRALSRLERAISGTVPLVVVNSEATREYHRNLGFNPARWAVVYNGFDVDRFRPRADVRVRLRAQLGIPAGNAVVGCVARFTDEKDHGTLLRAARIVRELRGRISLVLVGGGSGDVEARIREWIRALGLQDAVLLTGAQGCVEDYYAAFDVHVLPSTSESFPNALGEAMASQCPVIGTDVGGVRELVGQAGLIVPPRDERRLATALMDLLGDESRIVQLGVAGRKRVEAEFSVERMVRDTRAAWRDAGR